MDGAAAMRRPEPAARRLGATHAVGSPVLPCALTFDLRATCAVGSPVLPRALTFVTWRVAVRHKVVGALSVRRAREGAGKHESAGGEDRGDEPGMDLCV
jgi:hypothetical protein